MSSDEEDELTGNRLLDLLEPSERNDLVQHLTPVSRKPRDAHFGPNEAITTVSFPLTAVSSIVTTMSDGSAVEIATVGYEGLIGVPVFLGAGSMNGSAFCQVPGDYFDMPANEFERVLSKGGGLFDVVQRYTQALFALIAQGTACNRVHPVEERCARWLLLTHDRVKTDEFPLTQEFLGQMLGVRRATVNVAASLLQRAGYISYRRGVIRVTDRTGLEDAACECYAIIRDEFDRLLGRFSR
jgi:hypothetical protein